MALLGVPIVAQHVKNQTSIHRMQVRLLVMLSGLRKWCCWKLWHRLAAAASTWPLAWEFLYAKCTTFERPKKKKNWHLFTWTLNSVVGVTRALLFVEMTLGGGIQSVFLSCSKYTSFSLNAFITAQYPAHHGHSVRFGEWMNTWPKIWFRSRVGKQPRAKNGFNVFKG